MIAAVNRPVEYTLELLHPVGPVGNGDVADLLCAALTHGLVVRHPAGRSGKLNGRRIIGTDVPCSQGDGELIGNQFRDLSGGLIAGQVLDNSPFQGIWQTSHLVSPW